MQLRARCPSNTIYGKTKCHIPTQDKQTIDPPLPLLSVFLLQVQYNLFVGSIVALGTDLQRQTLYDTQEKGELGCFAFTEIGAGVLSGAGVETIATYNADKQTFSIVSPTPTSHKTWISQGMFAEHAVILANIIMPDGSNKGPHLFFSRIQHRHATTGEMTAVNDSVRITSLAEKTALRGLDNAYISFDHFEVPRAALLGRYSTVTEDGQYVLQLPPGNKRMLDVLISRLLTGRVCLSEYTVGIARVRVCVSVCLSMCVYLCVSMCVSLCV